MKKILGFLTKYTKNQNINLKFAINCFATSMAVLIIFLVAFPNMFALSEPMSICFAFLMAFFFVSSIIGIFLYLGEIRKQMFRYVYYICSTGLFLILLIQGHMNVTLAIILLIPYIYTLVQKEKEPVFMQKYNTKLYKCLLFIINLYFVFALVGNGLFLLESRMTLSLSVWALFILFFIALYPYGRAILHSFEKIRMYANTWTGIDDKSCVLKMGILSTAIVFFALLVISFGFYPAITTHDGSSAHWPMAMGERQITNAHPAAYTLFIKLTAQIAPTPYVYILVQILLFSGVIGAFLAFLYQKGLPKKIVIVFSFIFALLPNNYMTLMLLSKNPLFAVFKIWIIYLIIRLLDNPEGFCKDWLMISQFAIVLAALGLVRHNAFLAIAAVGILVIWITVRHYKEIKGVLLASFFVAIMLMQLVQGPVYDSFDVIRVDKSSAMYLPLVTPLASAVKNDVYIPDDIRHVMEQILPFEEWYERGYYRFNTDILHWRAPRPNYEHTNLGEIFNIYLRMLVLYPDIVIQDRLDSMESLWNVFPSRAEGAYNDRFRYGIAASMPHELLPIHIQGTEPIRGRYFKENAFTVLPLLVARGTSAITFTDIIVWRTGIYIVLFLYLTLFLFVQKERFKFFAILPSFMTLITLILVVGWQMYQYMWFFPLSVLIFLGYVLLVPRKYCDSKYKIVSSIK